MIYIAYKYTHTPDKIALRGHLEKIAQVVVRSGNENFILHRDKKNWGKDKSSQLTSAYHMIRTLPKAKQIVAFIDHDQPSFGLWLEIIAAKIMAKPITLLVKKGTSAKWLRKFASHVHEFSNHSELPKIEANIHKSLSHALAK